MVFNLKRSKDIMSRIAKGEADALRIVMSSLLDRVVSLSYRVLYSKDDAEDVAQEVFIKLYEQAPKWKALASLDTWVFRVTLNISLKVKKNKRTVNVTDIDKGVHLQQNNVKDAASFSLEKKEEQKVEEALKSLSERNRIAITLFYFDDLKIKEAAQVMEISEDAYESLLRRSRVKLRSILYEENLLDNNRKKFSNQIKRIDEFPLQLKLVKKRA